MRMYDIIAKKRDGKALSKEELSCAVGGYVAGTVPDYQMSALLMAIYLRGMTPEETAILTDVMVSSGISFDLSAIDGVKVDKHSTGGVGDKTTLVVAPIVAACGVKVAKMSGRGLGHTGGTLDKLESVPGTRTEMTQREFISQVNRIGLAVIGQSEQIAVADKKLYALRDVTATVDCIPLIASSILSKKLASGCDAILLDVTVGSGAFMKELPQALELARLMVKIGTEHGRKVAALLTDMEKPLGFAVGNTLEIAESIEVLRGRGPADLKEICLQLATDMLVLAGKGAQEACRSMAQQTLADGSAFRKCCQVFSAQGGDSRMLAHPETLPRAPYQAALKAPSDGFITQNDGECIGAASVALGAGRLTKEDKIDPTAGIVLHRKLGDFVKKGDRIATFYASDPVKFREAEEIYLSGMAIGPQKPTLPPLLYARVTADGVEML